MAEFKGRSVKQSEWFVAAMSIVLGAAGGVGICALLLCAASALIVKLGTIPTEMLPIITIVIGALGAFSGGYLTLSMYRKRGLITGLTSGLVMFAAIFVTSLISGSTDDIAGNFVKCGVFMLAGSIGGVVRVNRRQKVKRAHG